jgi:hypothetical protein
VRSVTKTCQVVNKPTPRISIIIESSSGTPFTFSALPDTGATHTIIAKDVANTYGLLIKHAPNDTLYAANDTELICNGSTKISVTYAGSHKIQIDALVTSSIKNDVFIGWHDLIALGVLSKTFPHFLGSINNTIESDSLEKIQKDYQDVLNDKLMHKHLSGPPMHIHVRDDIIVKPKKVLTARQIPIHWQEEASKVIKTALDDGIIEEVKNPTEWISPAFFVPKEGGKAGLRLVTDFSHLNQYIKRPIHPFPSSHDVIQDIAPNSKFFAKLDAVQGYFQIPLDEESSFYTTFLLPSGRYRYKRAPMGLSSSSDEWCQRSDAVINNIEGTKKIVDDILIWAPDQPTLYNRIRLVLDRCRTQELTISKRKLHIGNSIKFAGFIVTDQGVKPDPSKISAIANFPTPMDISSLHSFLGLANQLGHFIPDLAHMTDILRLLLRKDVAFQWLPEHQEAFSTAKMLLTSDMVVKYFDPLLPTEVLTDASRLKGLGYALVQRDNNNKIRLIQCGSRSLTPTESRYATIELECLAIQWAIQKSRHFLLGMTKFSVVTDHRPLLGIFKKDLDNVDNTRIQRYREKLANFNFDLYWTAGKTHLIADALSRAPIFDAAEDDSPDLDNSVNSVLCYAISAISSDPKLQSIYNHAANDSSYQAVMEAIRQDTPMKKLPSSHPAHIFSNVWSHVSIYDDNLLVYDNAHLIIPKAYRSYVLSLLHTSHSGIVKTRKAAQQLYYWPGMMNDIKMLIDKCTECQALRPSQPKEPLVLTTASEAFQQVAMDLFECSGKHYLVMVDRYSGYPFVHRLRSLATTAITDALLQYFLDWGFPAVIRSDGGPQFRTAFDEFCNKHDVIHELTSPYNPQSNGLAESAVKQVKHLLIKSQGHMAKFLIALAEWRNIPRADGFSPAQMFLGRRQRGLLPTLHSTSNPFGKDAAEAARQSTKEKAKTYFDQHAATLPILQPGQYVYLQSPISKRWDQHGTIISQREDGRSYKIRFDNGKQTIRNRRFIRLSENVKACIDIDTQNIDDPVSTLRRSARIAQKAVSFNI